MVETDSSVNERCPVVLSSTMAIGPVYNLVAVANSVKRWLLARTEAGLSDRSIRSTSVRVIKRGCDWTISY